MSWSDCRRRPLLLIRVAAFVGHIACAGGWSVPGVIQAQSARQLALDTPRPSRGVQLGLRGSKRGQTRIVSSLLDGDNFSPSGANLTSVHLVVPVLNEEKIMRNTLETLTSFLEQKPSWEWTLTVVDNGCTDNTRQIAKAFAADRSDQKVSVMTVPQRGRGRALRSAWMESDAAVQCYCDADLSSDLNSLAQAVERVAEGACDIAVASRVARGSEVKGRTLLRDITSYGYILLLQLFFWDAGLSDCQCGCKAVSRDAAVDLVPIVENNGWFFDTELLLLAAGSGYRVREVPVIWQDDRDSRVNVVSTVKEMLKGILRLKTQGWRGRSAAKAAAIPPSCYPTGDGCA